MVKSRAITGHYIAHMWTQVSSPKAQVLDIHKNVIMVCSLQVSYWKYEIFNI